MLRHIYRFMYRTWYIWGRGTRKNSHFIFFLKGFLRYLTPKHITRNQLKTKLHSFYKLDKEEQQYIQKRVNYYCKFTDNIHLPEDAPCLKDFTYNKRTSYIHDYVNSTYFFDAIEYTRYFSGKLRWAYNPGDINYLFPLPEITKSRPISPSDENKNNILLNLDKVRHFTWVADPYKWEQKECKIIFRGDIKGKPHRQRFIEMWKNHPLCDLNYTDHMSLYNHLAYRYIITIEGNDVASNLKWVMSSNSVAVMPRPSFETWFMEGLLIPNYHYIEIAADYHDLIEKVNYYESHPEEVKAIINHAHEWVKQFQNSKREDLISLMVLNKYFKLTGQINKKKNKYIINEKVKLSIQQKVNAQNKARLDVTQTANKLGFKTLEIVYHKYAYTTTSRPHHYPYFSDLIANIQSKSFIERIDEGDIILIQDFYLDYMQKIAIESLRRGAKVIFIVHDIHCIRFNKHTDETGKLNNASYLLVHTNAMKQKLEEMGVNTPMHVMTIFDYYSSTPMVSINDVVLRKHEIVFAGNLDKSGFLKELLNDNSNKNIKFQLYGIPGNLNIDDTPHIIYNGMFSPNATNNIHGGWGLVWDGHDIYSCTGNYGNYLRYNSSHKLSLYLACGMPIIVWEHSSLADWVKKENIGITIADLRHLSTIINSITNDEYLQKVRNARSVGEQIRNGSYLTTALKEIITKLTVNC